MYPIEKINNKQHVTFKSDELPSSLGFYFIFLSLYSYELYLSKTIHGIEQINKVSAWGALIFSNLGNSQHWIRGAGAIYNSFQKTFKKKAQQNEFKPFFDIKGA